MYSKSTKFLELPQWIPTDHPDFLTDMNTAMKKLDEQAEKTDHDHSDLREQVDALSIDMVTVKEQVDALQEKVDNLVNLEDNPVFIALKEHVDALQNTVDGIVQTDNRQDLDIQQLQSAITRIDETIGIIENHLQQHDSHFDIHDKELSDIKATILHIENDVDDLRTHVAHMEESVAQMETEVGHIKGEQITQNDRLDTLEAGKSEQDDKIVAIEERVGEQDTKISTIEQKVTDATTTAESALEKATNAETTANGASAETEVLTQALTDMNGRVDGIDERVTINTTSIGNLNQMYEDLDGRMDTLEQSDTKQNADIGRVEATLTEVKNNLTTTQTNLEQFSEHTEQEIAAVVTDVQSLDTRMNTAETDIQELKDRPSGGGDVTTEQFDALAARVTSTEEKNTEQDGKISTIETDVLEIDTELTELQNKLVTPQFRDDLSSSTDADINYSWIHLPEYKIGILVIKNIRLRTSMLNGASFEQDLPGFTIHPISGEIPVIFEHVHYPSTTNINVFNFTLTQLNSGSLRIKIALSTASPATVKGTTTINLGRTFVFHY